MSLAGPFPLPIVFGQQGEQTEFPKAWKSLADPCQLHWLLGTIDSWEPGFLCWTP